MSNPEKTPPKQRWFRPGPNAQASQTAVKTLHQERTNSAHDGPASRRSPDQEPNKGPDTGPDTTSNVAHQLPKAEARAEVAPAPVPHAKSAKPHPPKAGARVIEIAPVAPRAKMEMRHWIGLLIFALIVLVPVATTAVYLWTRSTDQFASVTGFTVRREDGGSGTDLLGGFASQISGSSTQSDNDILYEFIQSQELVARLNEKYDLVSLYSQTWDTDPAFSIWPDATVEDLTWYWGRMARVSYDQSSGLVNLRILSFEPRTAQLLTRAVLDESQSMINALNQTARNEAIRYAQSDLEQSLNRLKAAREALIRFRTRTQIVDLETDLQGRLGVVNNLQQQLAEALVESDLLGQQTSANDPRVVQSSRLIEVIRNRIQEERRTVTSSTAAADGTDYPSLLAEYEGLLVDRQFAEESYRASLTALDIASANAQRQSRYLAVFINPTLAEQSEYPQRLLLVALVAIFASLIWAVGMLIYYSARDSR